MILTMTAQAYEPGTDYLDLMVGAAVAGDVEAGLAAQEQRDEKIKAEGLGYSAIGFEDLYYLAKIAQAEAGDVPGEAGDTVCMGIMEVVMNRVASPEFSRETVKDIIMAPGQYYVGHPAYAYFEGVQPSERVLHIAVRVLEGERMLTPDVVFHSNGPMGGGSACSVDMGVYGMMHFSYSCNRNLYK